MVFTYGEYAWAAAAWLIMAYALYRLALRHDAAIRHWAGLDAVRRHLPMWRWGLRVVGTGGVVWALLGPAWETGGAAGQAVRRDIMIALDVSASMNCDDVRPSRLEKAKAELRDLMAAATGDRLGLVAFTDLPYVQCPLTTDLGAARTMLDLVATEQYAQTGTNLRMALVAAGDRLLAARELAAKAPVSQAIVVVSDGEDWGEGFGSVVARLREAGIAVFVVGIGSAAGSQVPRVLRGQQVGYVETSPGVPAVSRLNDAPLRALADAFGTEFVPVAQAYDDFGGLRRQLDALAYAPAATRAERSARSFFQVPLALGLLALLLAMSLLPERRA